MRRSHWIAVPAAAAAAAALAACAGTESNGAAATTTTQSQSATVSPAAANPDGSYSDAQLQAFIAAGKDIDRLSRGDTPEAQAQYAQQAGEILQRHGIAPDTFNAIATTSRTDQQLAARIAELRVANITDAELRAFAAAAREIEPISRSITAQSTPEQREQASNQISAVLARHDINAATYNAIAARAQSDPAFAARITAAAAAPGG